jgi:hypothetical protein
MCCILCEEPVRSITFGLAAVGIVAIVNGTRKFLARDNEPQRAEPTNVGPAAGATGDLAS